MKIIPGPIQVEIHKGDTVYSVISTLEDLDPDALIRIETGYLVITPEPYQ